MHKTSCAVKQRKGGPCAALRCKEGFALTGRTEPDKKPAVAKAKKGEGKMCEDCGTRKALIPSHLISRNVKRPLCSACITKEKQAKEEQRKKEEAAKFPGYDPYRAAFIASIIVCEAENGMTMEKPNSYRRRAWERAHEQALKIFQAYDKDVNKNKIYAVAERVVDVINAEMEKADE